MYVTALHGQHVLVTGGSGFIGTAVVRRLLDEGAKVTVADLRPFPNDEVRSVVGDLRDPANQRQALTDDIFGVIHLAALTSVLQSVKAPWDVYETNVYMTSALLERAREIGVQRFTTSSTNAVVGDVGHRRMTEDLPLRPLTPYGATKAAAEMLMSSYAASYGMLACPLRLTNVFGPGMWLKDSMVPRIMRAALKGEGVDIYGDGEQVRDFVHVDDVVAAILLALTEGFSEPVIIGAGRSYSVNELVAASREVTGIDIPARHVDPKPGEMPAVVVDPAKAHSLGWKAQVDMREGLETTWEFFQNLPDLK